MLTDMPKARWQSNAMCILDVCNNALGGRNNHACLFPVEILVVASENGKIKLKLHKFSPLLRPRKSLFADFVAHPSAVYAEVEMFAPLKSQQWKIFKRAKQC